MSKNWINCYFIIYSLLFFIKFIYNSYVCLFFFTITWSIIPDIHRRIAIIIKNPDTIKLGNLGTSPVLKYSLKTGIPKMHDAIRNKMANRLKKAAGLYSLNRVAIIFNTFSPSL